MTKLNIENQSSKIELSLFGFYWPYCINDKKKLNVDMYESTLTQNNGSDENRNLINLRLE